MLRRLDENGVGGEIHDEIAVAPDLSGKTEPEMVRKYGVKACTVCFPSAPTLPGYKVSAEQAKVEADKKAALRCPGSGGPPPAGYTWRQGKYVRCPQCGKTVSVTEYGWVRAHDRPKGKARRRR